MKVLFAADYRKSLPYQTGLARALRDLGIETVFYSHYRRGLPLTRGVLEASPDLLHLHWPEAFFPTPSNWTLWIRKHRYPFDLWLATRSTPMVLTMHNLFPHNRKAERCVAGLMRWTCRLARQVFVHSEVGADRVSATLGVPRDRLCVVPCGDLSEDMPEASSMEWARDELGLPRGDRIALIFGAISPYKGIGELIEFWRRRQPPGLLYIVGWTADASYAETIRIASASLDRVHVIPRRLSEAELACWLDAANCAIFNYEDLINPGAVQLAMARGLPILLPKRINAIDLLEPNHLVHRYEKIDTHFMERLDRAWTTPHDLALAARWKDFIAWPRIARIHREVYARSL
jgi:glycosyltransferase involved in cell wall biosynthesis